MPSTTHPDYHLKGIVARWTIGFVGSLTAILVVPRLARFAFRHYAFRLVAEIVAIVSLGLLTEKAMELLSGDPGDTESL